MTNKTTKSSLLLSSISLLLCFAMLIGTTFAWFTDSATSAGNKIVAGNLDVQLLMGTGTNVYTEITNESAPIFGGEGSLIAQDNNANTLWEPGKTQVAYLAIKNNGSLDLKYNVNLVVNNKAKDLYKAMEYDIIPDKQYGEVTAWTKAGKSVNVGAQLVSGNEDVKLESGVTHYFALAIHMQEEAGNEYQNGQVDFDIVVNATQLNSEADSFGPDYDKNATYKLSVNENGVYETNSVAGLSEIAKLASSDESITEAVYVDTEGNETTVPVARNSSALDSAIDDGNDVVVITDGAYTVDDAKSTEVTIVGNGAATTLSIESEGEHNTDYGFDGSTVTFENLTFNVGGYLNGYARMDATYNNCTINGTYTLNGNSVFNKCTFNKTGDDYCVWTWGAPTAEFNNCTFNTDGKAILLYGGANTVLKLTNCTLIDNGVISGKAAIETGSDWATDTKEIIVTNCTVNGFDVTEQKSVTWGGTSLGTNVWGNKNLLPTDRFNVVIDGVDVY